MDQKAPCINSAAVLFLAGLAMKPLITVFIDERGFLSVVTATQPILTVLYPHMEVN
jgi:hypothetical protein